MLALYSSVDLSTIFVFILALILGKWMFSTYNNKRLPPGPLGLPIVGYLPFLGTKPYITLQQLKKKYGSVYSLKIGSQSVIILADFKAMKEAFNKDAFIGRPPDIEFPHNKETMDLGVITGLPWKDLRKFSLHTLRDLGLGKSRLETHIAEEVTDLLERLEKVKGKPIFPRSFIAPSASNNIASLIFGNRRNFDDPKRIKLDESLEKSAKLLKALALLEFFPLLKKIVSFIGLGKRELLRSAMSYTTNYVREEIQKHVNTFDSNNVRDYIDKFLLEMEKQKSNPKSIFLIPVLEDFSVGIFFAGSSTLRGTLEWLMLISATYPDVQRRVQAEIDDVIGKERFPIRADHLQMPYTEATILEILRWRASLPINFPRYTIEDTTIGACSIPKNVQVIAVTWAVHHDPELWGEDVESFKPERFLSEDGKTIHKPEYFIPFSIGKRSCIGESLTYVQLFVYFTAILQKFHVRLPAGEKPDLEGVLGIHYETKPYRVCFDLR